MDELRLQLDDISLLPCSANNIGDGPEGPEVRVIADKLQLLLGNTLKAVNGVEPKFSPPVDLSDHNGKTINGVTAYGKKLLLTFNDKSLLVFSLGMTGRILFEPERPQHVRCELTLAYNDGTLPRGFCYNRRLYYEDMRKFGSIEHFKDEEQFFSRHLLGPDILRNLLSQDSSSPNLCQAINFIGDPLHVRSPICKVLLNQEILVGVGNYIKSEVLHIANIHPETIASHLTPFQRRALLIAIAKVMWDSYTSGGYTMSDFLNPDGTPGSFRPQVYGQKTYLSFPVHRFKTSDNRSTFSIYYTQ